MSDSVFNCDCCGVLFPDLYKHIHHKIPTSVGGPDTPSNLASLCPGCHDALHNIAYKLLSPSHSKSRTIDLLNIIYKENDRAKRTCLELAQFVRDSIIATREKGLSPDHLVQVGCTVDKSTKDLMTILCKQLSTTQEKFVLTAVLKEIKRLTSSSLLEVPGEVERIQSLKKKRRS